MIRACLLDIGNVIAPFSHERMCDQVGLLAGVSGEAVREELFGGGVFAAFEEGRITPAEVYRWFLDRFPSAPAGVTLDDLRVAMSDIFTRTPEWLPVLDGLRRQGIRLVSLSNTCVWHLEWIEATDSVLQRLDAIGTSWKVGALKPHPSIYEAALRLAGCAPDECLYTDDIPRYVEAATALGIHSTLFTSVAAFVEALAGHGIRL